MTEDTASSSCCHECKRPLMAIDFYGERLKGCPTCNIWWTPSDTKKRLAEAGLQLCDGTAFVFRPQNVHA
jgi:hypothetical protein